MQGVNDSGNCQMIEIFVSGRSLKNKDVFSKSDPFVKFYIRYHENNFKVSHKDKSGFYKDNLNPNFIKSFQASFIFETRQDCRFEVYDSDGSSSEMIGQSETTIGKLMGAQKQLTILELLNKSSSQGKLIVRCDNIKESNEYLYMKWQGVKLMNVDGWFGTSDPFLRFYKVRADKTLQKISETEIVYNNLNPMWEAVDISAGRLTDGSHDQPFKIECLDWEKDGNFQFIGEVTVTIAELKSGKKDFLLKNPKKGTPGTLRVSQFSLIMRPNFLDYIRGGLQLNLLLAVDFTGSNGEPNKPNSLHYINNNHPNQYQSAILSLGEILLAYDYDQKVPSYGFGAKTRFPSMNSQNQTLHCFPLSGNTQQVEAHGVMQILEQYNYALQNVELSGPTYFGPIIEESINVARQLKQEEKNVYTILLILTDGEIHDEQITIDAIVKSSHIPLSVIIVGIGSADFGNMEKLDGDTGLKDGNGKQSQRDLVQFVPFRQFNGNTAMLAKHLLEEIPLQVTKYHELVGKKPNAPIMADQNKMGYSQAYQQQQQQHHSDSGQMHQNQGQG